MNSYTDHHQKLNESSKCFYCDREGGAPFLMTANGELHCSRCFEDFSPSEFKRWIEHAQLIVEHATSVATAEATRVDAFYVSRMRPLCRKGSRAAA